MNESAPTNNAQSILVINTGSSSIKFQLFSKETTLVQLAWGGVYKIGVSPHLIIKTNQGELKKELASDSCHEIALYSILSWIKEQTQYGQLCAVAHRVVHGGTMYTKSVRVTSEVVHKLKALIPLAPLHQGHNITAIEIIHEKRPELVQIACFDTAFHSNHTPLFTTYALPKAMTEGGIRRYGFHGLSYEWVVYFLQQNHKSLAKGRIIVAHLGNGASLCAINNGVSIDTTMGMTALDGLPMGTRCGQLDPGAIIYMIRSLGLTPDEVESILYNKSGLLALSDLTSDVRLLQESKTPNAQLALDYFCLKTAQLIGSMAVALGGVDGIVFTGGIGENSAVVRDSVLSYLEFLKPFKTLIVPANEERIIAMHTIELIEKLFD
jgi:acetate kinase